MPTQKTQRKNRKALGQSLEMAHYLDAGSNKLKRRIRDLERLLIKKKDTLPSNVIVEKERTLQALKLELENHDVKEQIKKNAKKYHMVRFFERKKALRKYKKALKTYNEDESEQNKSKLAEAEINLCYVVNFPKSEKYISLFPSDMSDESSKTQLRRKAFVELVKKEIEQGTLPVSIADILKGKKLGEENIGIRLEKDESSKTDVGSENNKQEADNEEDDDFFE
ncbi:rRNA-processing protein EFG1 [Nakaseomyces bracarensis]|uniref:rRNA-processing protein EFG1 n=1 Tax=Nakaseomyces bracarensis TaxID=273131 RepID=A0ABR4NWX7_9SACH